MNQNVMPNNLAVLDEEEHDNWQWITKITTEHLTVFILESFHSLAKQTGLNANTLMCEYTDFK